MKLLVVTTSVREGRAGEKVANWFAEQAKQDGRFDVEQLDLKELNLSYELAEQMPGSVENGEYSTEEDRKWASKINSVDAVAFVTPEYNAGYPASLKNAVDHLYKEWNGKPVGFVGYGSSGAGSSFKSFQIVAERLKMNLVEQRVAIHKIWAAFEGDNLIDTDTYNKQATEVIDALESAVNG
jgi:NAD(P)H-dependent FMN reductase